MGTGLLRRDIVQLLQRRFAKRPARGSQHDPPNTDGTQPASEVAGQALEDRIVLAVDRQQHSATLPNGLHEQGTGHDQRFLVGQQYLLARLHRSQRRTQAGSSDNRGHDCVYPRVCGYFAQTAFADQHPGIEPGRSEVILQLAGDHLIRHYGVLRRVPDAQGQQFVQATEAGKREHLIKRWMTGNDIQSA